MGRSHIIFGMELQESPSAMHKKEFSMHMMKSAACALRCKALLWNKTLCCRRQLCTVCAIEL